MYDTTWIETNDDLLQPVAADQRDTHRIGDAFAMSADRPELLARLLGAGLRMPTVHTSCQRYSLGGRQHTPATHSAPRTECGQLPMARETGDRPIAQADDASRTLRVYAETGR